MTVRWRLCCCVLAVWLCAGASAARAGPGSGPGAAPEDDVPDAALDDEDELALHQEESRNVRPRAYAAQGTAQGGGGGALPAGFRPTASLAELAGYPPRPALAPAQYAAGPHPHPGLAPAPHPARTRPAHQLQRLREAAADAEAEAEEEEREEPDRLAQLLQQSKFQCAGKQGGYYADQELACEVFHYCQGGVKHSWICPDGFTFHQVHLICMPPTHDNICQKSAKYHFVNEYLYRPVNEEEVQRRPNVSLRYADRYYPAEVYRDDRYEAEDDEEEAAAPARPAQAQQQAAGGGGGGARAPQVFRSAEEVNIPLGHRRPQHRPYEFDF